MGIEYFHSLHPYWQTMVLTSSIKMEIPLCIMLVFLTKQKNVRNLLDLGADPMRKNSFGLTPINLAILKTLILGPQILGFQQATTPSGRLGEQDNRIKVTV
jgi:hypothetical protein